LYSIELKSFYAEFFILGTEIIADGGMSHFNQACQQQLLA
jgi:hypothetical protein